MIRRLYEILEPPGEGDSASRNFELVVLALILLSVGGIVVESTLEAESPVLPVLHVLDAVVIVLFTLEYGLRIWTCTLNDRFRGAFRGRVRFAVSFMSLVDLVAIIPFYLALVFPIDGGASRMIRLLRLSRFIKMGRYSRSLQLVGRVFRSRRGELGVTAYIALIVLLVSSTLLYVVEREVNPDAFGSIPRSAWWAVAALSTVGYGDAYPVTNLGRVVASVTAFCALGLFALPAGILGSGIMEELRKERGENRACPHCGKDL